LGFTCILLDRRAIVARVSKVQHVQVTGVQVYGKERLLLSTQEETASEKTSRWSIDSAAGSRVLHMYGGRQAAGFLELYC
jgi:hypothetical protein